MHEKKNQNIITEVFANPKKVTAALKKGILEAIKKHREAGKPIVVWQKGRAVWIKPERINAFIKQHKVKK